MKMKLGNSNIMASRLCFGGEQLGGHGYGKYDVGLTIKAAYHAIEQGLNFFDTADCYGLGVSEKNLGKIISDYRDKMVISTKFGVKIYKGQVLYDNSPDYMIKCLSSSLKRLNTSYIDLYQIHHYDGVTHLEEIFTELEKEVERGRIRRYGICNMAFEPEVFKAYPGFLSISNEYSLVQKDREKEIIRLCEAGHAFIGFGVLGQGILSGKYSETTAFKDNDRRSKRTYANFHGEKLASNLRLISAISKIAQELKLNTSEVAIAYAMSKIPTGHFIVGMKNSEQLGNALKGSLTKLSESVIQKLDQLTN